MSDLARQLIQQAKETHATTLDLGRCGLTEWPKELFELEQLETLIMSNRWYDYEQQKWIESENRGPYNLLSEIPGEIEILGNLKKLFLGGSDEFYVLGWKIFNDYWKIHDFTPLKKLSELRTLYLGRNLSIDISVLGKLSSLSELYLKTSIPNDLSSIEQLEKLQTLAIGSSYSTDISVLAQLRKLCHLYIIDGYSKFMSILSQLIQLQSLHLTGLDWDKSKQINDAISPLLNLKSLNISNNKLQDISMLRELSKLEHLDMSNNRVRDGSILENLKALKTLRIGQNGISDLSFITQLKQLQNLDISKTPIKDLSLLSGLTKLESLKLHKVRPKSISVLQQLGELRILDLKDTRLTDIYALGKLSKLQTLDLSFNGEIEDFSVLGKLSQLQNLNIGVNKLREIPDLSKLENLRHLNLGANRLTDISALAKLPKLVSLDLHENQLTSVSELGQMTQLKTLNLWKNRIQNLSGIENLKNLQILNLIGNQLTDILSLYQLRDLRILYMSFNKEIKDYSVLSQLTQLYALKLNNNQLTDVSFLSQLTNLQTLDLSKNQLSDISALLPMIQGGIPVSFREYDIGGKINLFNNLLTSIPLEIREGRSGDILNYFSQIDKQGGTEPLYAAKVLIVGEAGAGKTTLLKKLTEEHYVVPRPEGEEEIETVGINIHEGWEFPFVKDSSITFSANLWDFGGQAIQFMTHQFFLTSQSLYVLLADDRRENTKFPYWFEIINLLSADEENRRSPVLVVLNEREKAQTGFSYDHEFYKKKYPDLDIRLQEVDFSNDEDGRLNFIRDKIKQLLCTLPHVGRELPKQWRYIREDLDKLRQAHINWAAFRELCSNRKVSDEEDQKLVSTYLHRLGYIIHFQEDRFLRDFIILDTEWALEAIYRLLLHKSISNSNGLFSDAIVDEIWENLTNIEQNNLLSLMKGYHFDLIYEVEDQPGHYISPLLLSEIKPEYRWEKQDVLRFRYDYKFMPEGILTRMIVRKSPFIFHYQKIPIAWKRGVVLEYEDCKIQITEDPFPDQIIDVEISGKESERKNALAWVRGEMAGIHRWFKNVEKEEKVPCNCMFCKDSTKPWFYDYEVLVRREKKGQPIFCNLSDEEVSASDLLAGVFVEEEIRQMQDHSKVEAFIIPEPKPTPKRKILFLAATPTDTSRNRMNKEHDEIRESLRRSNHRNEFAFESRFAVKRVDISRALMDEEPHIVHFAGSGSDEGGIVVENRKGEQKAVSPDALADLFELFEGIECVLLNACYSELQAEAIAECVPYVIGMGAAISDESVIAFAKTFYDALGNGREYEFAFKMAKTAIDLEGLPEGAVPHMHTRE